MGKQTYPEWDRYTYDLTDVVKGHSLLALSYEAKKWSLIGSWSATIGPKADGSYDLSQFPLGGLIDFEALEKAVLLSRRMERNKAWRLEGNDIARLLDRTAPDPSLLPSGNVDEVVAALCNKCGVPCDVTGGLPSSVVKDARALVSATKVADIIVELAQLSGKIAYIDTTTGTLKFAENTEGTLNYTDDEILEYGGDELDLDNYAKGVCVILHRKKQEGDEQQEEPPPPSHHFYGQPLPSLSVETISGDGITGQYIQPIGVPLSLNTTTTEEIGLSEQFSDPTTGDTVPIIGTVTINTSLQETFTYDSGHKPGEGMSPSSGGPVSAGYGITQRDYWDRPRTQENAPFYNENTEHREFKWIEKSHHRVTTVTKSLQSSALNITVRETTIEKTDRIFSNALLTKETYSRQTRRELVSSSYGDILPDATLYLPPHPDFDEIMVAEYRRSSNLLTVTTTTKTNDLKEVGSWAVVHEWRDNQWKPVILQSEGNATPLIEMAVKGMAFPEWVQKITVEEDKEFLDSNGNAVIRAHSLVSDDGGSYVAAKGWVGMVADTIPPPQTPGEEEEVRKRRLIEAAYNAFSSQSANASVEFTDGAPSDNIIQSYVCDGYTWYWKNIPSESWYDPATGQYRQVGGVCPHYSDTKCNIADIDVIWDYTDRKCPNRNGFGWSGCPRALAALENENASQQDIQFMPPITCRSSVYPAQGQYEPVYTRNVYLRDDIPGNTPEELEANARAIGVAIANNLLKIKSARGWVRTITVPLDLTKHVDGTIMSVSHDYKAKKTTISYRVDAPVPDFLNSNSPQSMAFYIWERENNRNTRSVYGTVVEIKSKQLVVVQVGDGMISCVSKIISLKVGDSVRVSLPAGNRMDGVIEERM